MAYIFDGPNKLIILTSGTVAFEVNDLYSRWKDWVVAGNAAFFDAMSAIGGDPLPGGGALGVTAFLENGWKLRPHEADHVLTVDGNLYSRDGSAPFVSTLGDFNVRIEMRVSNLVDQVGGGSGGGLTPTQAAQLAEILQNSRDTRAALFNQAITDFVVGKLKLYNGAGAVTHQGNIYHDAAGTVPANGTQAIVRRNALLPVP